MLHETKRASLIIALTLLCFCVPGLAWAGDIAVFTDLGFSPDGNYYMFGQYGVKTGTLQPWADAYLVDVAANDFVSGGRLSYTGSEAVGAGQDGSGALYSLIGTNGSLAAGYAIDFLHQGRILYIAIDSSSYISAGNVEFRDFEQNTSYSATVVPSVNYNGNQVNSSSFYISLEQTRADGISKGYIAGSPEIERPGVASYRIRRVMASPENNALIFVIEMRVQNGNDFDIRYMIESLKL